MKKSQLRQIIREEIQKIVEADKYGARKFEKGDKVREKSSGVKTQDSRG